MNFIEKQLRLQKLQNDPNSDKFSKKKRQLVMRSRQVDVGLGMAQKMRFQVVYLCSDNDSTPFQKFNGLLNVLTAKQARGVFYQSISSLPKQYSSIDRRISIGRWVFYVRKARKIKRFWAWIFLYDWRSDLRTEASRFELPRKWLMI